MQSRLLASTATLVGLLGAGFLSPNAAMQTAQAQTQRLVSSPTAGVVCDQFGPTCYDRQGASVRYTQTYFGNNAANRLRSKLRNKAVASDVMLSNGTLCDFRAATCWSDGWRKGQVASQISQQLFGWAPSPNPGYGNGLQGLETPRAGVVCDQSTKTCYDQTGLSMGLTRDYFGTPEKASSESL